MEARIDYPKVARVFAAMLGRSRYLRTCGLDHGSRTSGAGVDGGGHRPPERHVPDETSERVRRFFTEKELADLTRAIAAINGWNRHDIAGRAVPGAYRPPRARELERSA
jgi:hypothetical protein